MQTYQKKNTAPSAQPASAPQSVRAAPLSMDALRSGLAQPSSEQLGQRVDLPGALQAKMEHAFGMDFSGIQIYRSQAVADAGAQAVAQGSRVAFAPDRLDFSSRQGQALLGHELSHVASQARGEVYGQGFLDNAALESQADREGALAAAGESAGPVTGALSSVSAAGAAGPMQAKKDEKQTPAPAPPDVQADSQNMAFSPDWQTLEFNPGALMETIGDWGGTASGVVDPDTLESASKFLKKDMPVLKGPSGKAGGWLEKVSKSKVTRDVGYGLTGLGLTKSVWDTGKSYKQLVKGIGDARKYKDTEGLGGKILDAVKSTAETVGTGAEAMETFGVLKDAVPYAGAANILEGAVDLAQGFGRRRGHKLDEKQARIAAGDLKKRAGDAGSVENYNLLYGATKSMRNSAKVRQMKDKQQIMDGTLEVLEGGFSLIPGFGSAASAAIGAVQTVADLAVEKKIDDRLKDNRRDILGEDHYEKREALNKEMYKVAKEFYGREPTHREMDRIKHKVKHAQNAKIRGNGVVTDKQMALMQTADNVDKIDSLMREKSSAGELASSVMFGAGHLVEETGGFTDKNDAISRMNSDLEEGEDYQEFMEANAAHQVDKYDPVGAALATEKAKKERKNAAVTGNVNKSTANQRQAEVDARKAAMTRRDNKRAEIDKQDSVPEMEDVKSGPKKGFFRQKWDHLVRSHDRVRDNLVNKADDFKKLSWTSRFGIAITNPLAWISSKFDSGKAKTEANNKLDARLNEALPNELARLYPSENSNRPGPAASGTHPATPDVSKKEDKKRRKL